MEKKIVFFDIDGTLLNEAKQIPASTKKAIQLLQESGVYTAIATGRVPYEMEWILEELNIRSFVSINGQYVVFEGKEIYTNPMDPAIFEDITQFAKSHGHPIAFCNHQEIRATAAGHPYIQASYRSLNWDYPPVDKHFYKHFPIFQGHLFCKEKDEQIYIERYPEYSFIRWHECAMDILPKGCSKAVGIQKLLEVTGIKKENSYAFGDGLNDIEMLQFVGTGVAMGNAVPELKEVADVITASSSEDGIFQGLVKIGLLDQ
ncbi:Cof-type HAD-IIB family hydrolase [Thermoflavimicrobium dichotomicum]|uniref:Cof subfamily of IIB subfamily of haloacid dehalogenase superfamily/HAD-superfamily hydrolase, subfamily IIB n=1 Tax=Thermoflavimicrobium dichotomicum TaxID=46223 RepID=A0A1I3S9I4_9BACL|nr:Cof-type HAD-IIB family hydrolase [Thermoflavimicrobium dichotomicum]SFJ54269.1 hypothetical protein SAMN05421852_11238 [Thermoflavimicrobium dichotomicum]